MTVAVTGASGQLGGLVAHLLLDRLDPSEVVLLTRKPENLADLATRGADVRAADFDDASTLDAAFAGVDKVLLISTDTVGARVAGHRAAIDAAVRAGVTHLAYTSITRPEPGNPAAVVPDHAATEEAVVASGLTWTMLRNNLYSDMQGAGVSHAAETGQLVTNLGDGATAYVTRADCAAVAAAVLTSDGHDNVAYDVTGPAAVSARDLADLAAAQSGRPVEVIDVDDAAYIAGLAASGMPAMFAELLASFTTAAREGYLGTVTTVVEDLMGRPATPLAAIL